MYLENIYVDCGIDKLHCWEYLGWYVSKMCWSTYMQNVVKPMKHVLSSRVSLHMIWVIEHVHGEEALNLMNIYLKKGGSFRVVQKDKSA